MGGGSHRFHDQGANAGSIQIQELLGSKLLYHNHGWFGERCRWLKFRAIDFLEDLVTYLLQIIGSFPYVVTHRLSQKPAEELSRLQNCLAGRLALGDFYENLVGEGNISHNGKMRFQDSSFGSKNFSCELFADAGANAFQTLHGPRLLQDGISGFFGAQLWWQGGSTDDDHLAVSDATADWYTAVTRHSLRPQGARQHSVCAVARNLGQRHVIHGQFM